jgi:uncharacterized circularly permuted ATP-grasp superfamily protein/uncharacterized alpha-E superfamily protein
MPKQLLENWRAADSRYDELLAAPLTPRPHFRQLFEALLASTSKQLLERAATVERQVRENGVTYNVYADAKGLERPWDLDPLPFMLPANEWAAIEAGIASRAALLNRILADLYGPQELLRSGAIPPALVFGHGAFLRAAHGIAVPGGTYLHLYAADLARSPDGQWWVIADRTEAPSGAGYALENRLIVSRVFPELFRDQPVQRLAGFFATLRDSLSALAPHGKEAPLTVLLTPGPYNETYFEHAFLARYLGYPLVEGGDLTVRQGRVWLKTVGGLRPVHAILRRQDSDFCDPVELRFDSALGVPGLTECARRGTVLVANALGSGVMESGSLLGFLPRLATALTGEPLGLPSVATWWCGEPAAREDALARLDKLIFKAANPAFPFEPVFGDRLSPGERAALVARVRANPDRYLAQEAVQLSRAPVLDREHGRRLLPRAVGLRVYAAATSQGYVVMPGALVRTGGNQEDRVVSMQRGGGSKDAWVLTHGPINTAFSLLPSPMTGTEVARPVMELTSRAAENLFWFGRYAERCDHSARLLRVALGRILFMPDEDDDVLPITALTRRFGLLQPNEDPDAGLLAAATLPDRPLGLAANLGQLARVGFVLRERLSLDNWRTINRLTQDAAYGRAVTLSGALTWLDRAITGLMTLTGFALDGMTRDTGWRFLSIGRRLERLTFMALALDSALHEGRQSGLTWLLELGDSIVTYRARYRARPQWQPTLDILVLDESNPRSIAFQARGMADFLARLEAAHGPCGRDLLAEPMARLAALRPDHDLAPDSAALADALAGLRAASFAVSDHLSARFFSHAGERRLSNRAA